MKTFIELRTSEPWFIENLETTLVEDIGYGVWRLVIDTESPVFDQVSKFVTKKWQTEGVKPYHYAGYERRYSDEELAQSEFLQLSIDSTFEPAGEETGTAYDYSEACETCGASRIQRSPLILDTRKIPRRAGFSQTIAYEIVVSGRVRDLMENHNLSGASLLPVVDSGSLTNTDWSQLVIDARVDVATPPAIFGVDPFDLGAQYRCPKGDTLGLNLLSELYIHSKDEVHDVNSTSQFIGYRQGLLVPFPLIVISQRFYQLLKQHKIKGFHVEVVHCVS